MLIVFWELLCNDLTQSSERPGSTKEVDDEDNATRPVGPVGKTEVTPSQPQRFWQPQANNQTKQQREENNTNQ